MVQVVGGLYSCTVVQLYRIYVFPELKYSSETYILEKKWVYYFV